MRAFIVATLPFALAASAFNGFAGPPTAFEPKKLERPAARYAFAGHSVAAIDGIHPIRARRIGPDQIEITHTTFFGAKQGAQKRREDVTVVRPNEFMPVGVFSRGGWDQTVSVMATPAGRITTEYRTESAQPGTTFLHAAQQGVELRSVERGESTVTVRGLAYELGPGARKAFTLTLPASGGPATYDLGRVGAYQMRLELDGGGDLKALSVLH
jgi:hypothetical protein